MAINKLELFERSAEGRYQRRLAQQDKEDAQQERVCEAVGDLISTLINEFGWENNFHNRQKLAEMINKTF